MTVPWLLIAVGLMVGLGFSGVMLVRRRSSRTFEPDWNWVEDFSVSKYRPMQRLLNREDYQFLAAQRGYDPSIAKTLRKDRRRVFRSYLSAMHRDFDRLYYTAKSVAVHAQVDQSQLLQALVTQRAVFIWAMFLVNFRLTLNAVGVDSINTQPLFEALESLRNTASILQPSLNAA